MKNSVYIILTTVILINSCGYSSRNKSGLELQNLKGKFLNSTDNAESVFLTTFTSYPEDIAQLCTAKYYLSEEDRDSLRLIAFSGTDTNGAVFVHIKEKPVLLRMSRDVHIEGSLENNNLCTKYYYSSKEYDIEIEEYSYKQTGYESSEYKGIIRLIDKTGKVLFEVQCTGETAC